MLPTIFDVIGNFWGDRPVRKIQRADKATLASFGEEVNRFYDSYTPAENPEGQLRTYLGGLAATNFALGGKQRTFFNDLLYAHSTIVPDPIALWYFDRFEELSRTPPAAYPGHGVVDQSEWIGWVLRSHRAFQWDVYACRNVLAFFVSALFPLKPLVEAGIVVIASQPHLLLGVSREISDAAMCDASDGAFQGLCESRADEHAPLWDNLRGGVITTIAGSAPLPAPVVRWARAKEAAYHLRKNLSIAAACGGAYIPENQTDFGLVANILERSGEQPSSANSRWGIARKVEQLHVPSLEGLSVANLVSIRKDEAAFEEFRSMLARRLLSPAELDQAVIDLSGQEIEAEISSLRSQLRTSNVIKGALRDDGVRIVVTALISAGATWKPVVPVATAAAGSLVSVYSALRKRDRNSETVVARLASMTRTAPDAIWGREGLVAKDALPRALAVVPMAEVRTGPNPRPAPAAYTAELLRGVVERAMAPNTTGQALKVVRG